jgi:hypothetical protein
MNSKNIIPDLFLDTKYLSHMHSTAPQLAAPQLAAPQLAALQAASPQPTPLENGIVILYCWLLIINHQPFDDVIQLESPINNFEVGKFIEEAWIQYLVGQRTNGRQHVKCK